MEWADIVSLYRYWDERPPVHELAAAYLGLKPRSEPAREVPASDIAAFFADMKRPFAASERRGVA